MERTRVKKEMKRRSSKINTYNYSSYLTESTRCLHYKYDSVKTKNLTKHIHVNTLCGQEAGLTVETVRTRRETTVF